MQTKEYGATDNSSIEQLKETDTYLEESYAKLLDQFSRTASLAQSHSETSYEGPTEINVHTVDLTAGENIDNWIDSEHNLQKNLEETDKLVDEVFDYIRFIRQEIEPESEARNRREAEQFYDIITEIDRIESNYYDIEHEIEKIRQEINEGRKVNKEKTKYDRVDIENTFDSKTLQEISEELKNSQTAN